MKIRNYILNDLVVGVDDSYVTKPDDVQLSFIEAQIDTGSTGKIKKIGGKLLRNIPYKLDNNYLENEKEEFSHQQKINKKDKRVLSFMKKGICGLVTYGNE